MTLIKLTCAGSGGPLLINMDRVDYVKEDRNGRGEIVFSSGVVLTVKESAAEIRGKVPL